MIIDKVVIHYSFKGERKEYTHIIKVKHINSMADIIEDIQELLYNGTNITDKDNDY